MKKSSIIGITIILILIIGLFFIMNNFQKQNIKAELPDVQVIYSISNGWIRWEANLTIDNKGFVLFEEQMPFKGNKTKKSIQLSDEEIYNFKKLVSESDVFNFEDNYDCEPNCPTDQSSSSVKFIIDSKEKLIYMYVPGEMPEKLKQILKEITDMMDKVKLTNDISKDSTCLKAGEIYQSPGGLGKIRGECCDGMDTIAEYTLQEINCELFNQEAGGNSICSNCGNNNCEIGWENICNCPEDCK